MVIQRSEVLTAVRIKITIFWDVTQCSLVNMYQYFKGICCLHFQGRKDISNLKRGAAGSSVALASIYQTSLCHIPGHNLDNADILPQTCTHVQKTSYKNL
jgi:hypothetical protein